MLDKCPRCGGEVVEKSTEKLLRGGANTALVSVVAGICLRCGEQMYPLDIALRFDYIREKLARQDVGDFQPIGRFFRVADGYGESEALLKGFDSTSAGGGHSAAESR